MWLCTCSNRILHVSDASGASKTIDLFTCCVLRFVKESAHNIRGCTFLTFSDRLSFSVVQLCISVINSSMISLRVYNCFLPINRSSAREYWCRVYANECRCELLLPTKCGTLVRWKRWKVSCALILRLPPPKTSDFL